MLRRVLHARSLRVLMSVVLVLPLLFGMSGVAVAAPPVANDDVMAGEFKIPDPGGAILDRFGASMAIDGDRVVVGAPGTDDADVNDGMVYVYNTSGGSWSLEATLTPPATIWNTTFEMGWSVDIDGDTIVAGAPRTTHYDALNGRLWRANTGLAFVYRFDGSSWGHEATLMSGTNGTLERDPGEQFGYAVAITGDAIAVGAPYYQINRGRTQFFSRTGSTWTRRSSVARAVNNARYGYELAAADDAILVGSPGLTTGTTDCGAVEVFDVSDARIPTYRSRQYPPSVVRGVRFGESIAADGDKVLIGGPGLNTNDGAIWSYELSGHTLAHQGGLAAPVADTRFGREISLDGAFAVAGTPNALAGLGSAWLLWDAPTGWTALGQSSASDGATGAGQPPQYGASVVMTGTAVLVGAPREDDPVAEAGAVYLHEFWTMTEGDPPLTVADPGVLGNDTDPENDSIVASLTVEPSGEVTLAAGGGFEYSPFDGDWFGVDTFTYVSLDATGTSNPADAKIIVLPVNDPPSFTAGPNQSTDEDAGVVTVPSWATSVTAGPYEDSQSLTFSVSNDDSALFATQPNVNAAGDLTYRPAANANGTATVSVYLTDDDTMGGPALSSSTATFTITVNPVNDPPSFAMPNLLSVLEDAGSQVETGWASALSAGPANEASQTLSFTTVNDNPGLFSQEPTVAPDGTLYFESAANVNGSAEVTVTITDDDTMGGPALSYSRHFQLRVLPVNDPPVGVNDHYSIDEDGLLIRGMPGVLINDTDIEAPGDADYFGPILSRLETYPAHGALFLFDDGSFVYSPEPDYSGVDHFTYRAYDHDLYSDITTVTITVDAVNDEPVIDQGSTFSTSTAEDTTLMTTLTASDRDGDPLTWSVVTPPSNGSASVSSADTTGVVTYTPDQDYNGTDAFTVMVADGVGGADLIVIQVTVTPVNDAPVASDISYTTPEDTPLFVPDPGCFLGAEDVDGDPFTGWLVMGGPSTHGVFNPFLGGGFIYTPDPDFVGTGQVQYAVYDGTAWSNVAAIYIDVTPVNDAPDFVGGGSISVAEDSGPYAAPWASGITAGAPNEMQSLTFDVSNDNMALFSTQPSLSSTGTLTFEPAANANGTATVSAQLTDDDTAGGPALSSAVVTFTIEVTPVNDKPVAIGDSFAATEDETLTVVAPGVLGNDTDIDGDALSASVETTPSHGQLVLSPDGSFTYVPDADYNGSDRFTYRASDGTTQSAPATVTIDVAAVNDAPVAAGEAYETDEEVELVVAKPGLLGNDTDIDGDALESRLATGPLNGVLTLASDGSFTYVPPVGWSGRDTFSYVAFDGETSSTPVAVEVTVKPVDTGYARLAGRTRFATAEMASQMSYPGTMTAETVVVTTAYNWPDALSGAGLAGATDAPVLLTTKDALPSSTVDEIERLGAKRAYVIGGRAVVSSKVLSQLQGLLGTDNVTRLGGADRYETAALVASETVSVLAEEWDGTMMLATGRDFPDAIAASPLSASAGWPLVLVKPSGVTTQQAAWVRSLGTSRTVVLGGRSSIPDAAETLLAAEGLTAERVSGSDRYSTSVSIAEYGVAHAGLSWNVTGIATGQDFPDALVGGVYCAKRGGLMLLNPRSSVSPIISRAMSDHRAEIYEVLFLGGTDAISQGVQDTIYNLLR